MGFFKTLFGGKESTAEEKQEQKEQYNFEVLTYDGTQALHMGKTDYAIACLTHALDIREDEDTRRSLAQAYIRNDDLASAAEQYTQLSELHPDDAAYPLALAETQFQQDHYTEAEQACLRALDIDPQLAMPHYLLACSAKAQADIERAADEAAQALAAKDDYDEARLLHAEALIALKQYAEAEADIDRLLQADAPADEALLLKATLCTQQERNDEAILFYRRAIAQNPFVPTAYIGLCTTLRRQGKQEEAAHVLREATDQLGFNPEEAVATRQDGTGQTVEDYMRNAYNALNPYQLNVSL